MKSGWALTLATFAIATAARADGGDPVVVTVGKSLVRASEISARLADMHEFERKSFGSNDTELKRAFLERKLVPQVLAAEEARARGFDKDPAVVERSNEVLVQALKASIQAEVDAALAPAEVRAYCEARKSEQKVSPATGTRGSAIDCTRDHLSYRIALRREKAHARLSELRARLKKENVRGVDYELLTRLELPGPDAAPKSSR